MKKLVLVVVLTAIISPLTFAQQDDDSIPPMPPRRSKAAKVGAFGGFTPGWLFVDVNPINEFLVPNLGAALKDDGVVMFGGAGSAYIMFLPNVRVGGVGMSGSISSTSLELFPSGQRLRRDAELTVGFGGVTIEYVVPIVERLDVAFGTMLGGGGIDITLRVSDGSDRLWTELWGNFGGASTGSNFTHKLSGSYFVWVPSVSLEYAALGWLGARLGASYVGMSAPSWELDNKAEILGVPGKVNGKGFMVNAGLFVGTF